MKAKLKLGLESVLAITISIECSSCAVSNTRTNQDMGYQGHPMRIYVIANLDSEGDGVTDEFYKGFSERVTACGGQTELFKPRIATQGDALSLDSLHDANDQKRVLAGVDAFAPDAILTMRVANLGVDTYGQKLSAVVNSKLWDYGQKKVIWAGVSNMALGGMWTTSEMRAKSLSKDVASKLRQGGLIPSCAANAG
jgi:hypothetical protein